MLNDVQAALANAAGLPFCATRPLHGGDIADVVRMGDWVIKTARTEVDSTQFLIEAEGLRALSRRGIPTPTVTYADETGIVMPYHQPHNASTSAYASFGEHLAALHLNQTPYSSAYDTIYLGAIPLSVGNPSRAWGEHFVEDRLRPLLTMAHTQGHRMTFIELDWLAEQDFPLEGRCLIHGDLWTGNLLICGAQIELIDPSCWYGERGLDIAMLTLFGDLPSTFWSSYESLYPISAHVRRFIPVYQLYYALAHVCLFGQSYVALCRNLWQQFEDSRT